MISSEVQRTLVKSPPELWTELSDPESLARHLGELGEIRITRTEPENLVEWEAEGTTGTVEIAPSGWGTRVTLTVVSELPPEAGEEPVADAQDSAADGPDAEIEVADAAGDSLEGELAGAAAAADAALLAPQAPTGAGAETAHKADMPHEAVHSRTEVPEDGPGDPDNEAADPAETPATVLADGPSEDPIAERKPAPATEAARRAAGWPAGGHEPGPAIESDLRAAEALEGAPAEPDGMHEWAAQAIEPDEDDLNDEYVLEQEPEPPKRGLFARLFGRRRGRAKAARLDEPALELADFEDSGDAGLEEAELPELQAEELEPTDAATDEPETAAEEPADATGSEDIEPEPATLGAHEPDADDLEAAAQAGATFEATAQPGATAHAEEPPPAEAPQHETTAQAEDPEPSTPVEDLAAELRAAEEVAAEQVEAVLTAVLDRLGSAHHRPFSRP